MSQSQLNRYAVIHQVIQGTLSLQDAAPPSESAGVKCFDLRKESNSKVPLPSSTKIPVASPFMHRANLSPPRLLPSNSPPCSPLPGTSPAARTDFHQLFGVSRFIGWRRVKQSQETSPRQSASQAQTQSASWSSDSKWMPPLLNGLVARKNFPCTGRWTIRPMPSFFLYRVV